MSSGRERSFRRFESSLVRGRDLRVSASASLVVASVLVGAGCEVTPRTDPIPDEAMVARPGTPSEWASLARSQNHRLELLDLFTSAGTITIDMRDDDDRMQREQADHRIWRGGAAKSAIKISKLGSTLISAAWNGPRWWIFDESGDEVTLRIRTVGARSSVRGTDRLLAPPILMAMIGLVPFPAVVPEDFVGIGEGFRFTLRGIEVGDGSDRLFFPGGVEIRVHRPLDGPAAVRLLDESGAEVAWSELTRVESVDRIGSPPGAWPRVPHRVEIRRDRGERLVMSFDAPLAGGRISDRLFDLDVQIERSKPVRIDEIRGPEEE